MIPSLFDERSNGSARAPSVWTSDDGGFDRGRVAPAIPVGELLDGLARAQLEVIPERVRHRDQTDLSVTTTHRQRWILLAVGACDAAVIRAQA